MVNLNAGTYSSINIRSNTSNQNNVAIAYGSKINSVTLSVNPTAADKVVLNNAYASGSFDNIYNLASNDKISIKTSIFGNLSSANLAVGAGLTTASNSTSKLIVNSTTGDVYYDADGSAAASRASLVGASVPDNLEKKNSSNKSIDASVVPKKVSTAATIEISATALASYEANVISASAMLTQALPAQVTTAAMSISAALSYLTKNKTGMVTIADTAANIASQLNSLATVNSRISSITQTGLAGPIAISASQLASGAAVLGKINNGDYSLAVSGVTLANFAGISNNAKVVKMNVEQVTAAAANTIAVNTKVVSIKVADSSANIAANLESLNSARGKIDTISQTGNASPLTIDANKLSTYTSILAKIDLGRYTLALTNTSSSNLNSVALNTKVSSIQVSDSSDKIAANLGALSNLASKITTINQVGPRTNISVDASKLAELNKVLGKVDSGAYTLAVTGADTASVASLSGNSKVATIAVKNVLASNFA